MPDLPQLPRVADPLPHLRAAVDAHRTATQAAVDAGAQVQADKRDTSTATGEAAA